MKKKRQAEEARTRRRMMDGMSLSMIVRKIRLDRCAGQERQNQRQGLDKGGLTADLRLQDAGIQAFQFYSFIQIAFH